MESYNVGDIFITTSKVLDVSIDMLGVCFLTGRKCIYIIFENGRFLSFQTINDIGHAHSPLQQVTKKVGFSHAVSAYKFFNWEGLPHHFKAGVFAPAFSPIFKQTAL